MSRKTMHALAVLLLAVPVAALAQQTGTFNDGRYIIKMRSQGATAGTRLPEGDAMSAGDAEVETAGGIVLSHLEKRGSVVALLSDEGAARLRAKPGIASIEPDSRRYPLAQTTPWGITRVQADNTVFKTTASSGNVMVCIIDSGYQRLHVDLPDTNVTGTFNAGTGNWYEDTCGHGSHVAGTIAALDNTTGVVGVNGDGTLPIHIQKVFDGASCGWSYASDLAAAVDNCTAAAAAQGKRAVFSMSLGGGTPSATEQAAFDNAVAAGHLMVAAAGNAGDTTVSYPAGYASVMSVAAVDSANNVAGFSQRNADVEIAAPGVDVLSTVPTLSQQVIVGGTAITGLSAIGAATTTVQGALVDGGTCNSVGVWSGKIVLCARDGTVTFATKATNVISGGGIGIVFVNNLTATLAPDFGGVTKPIPAIGVPSTDGTTLRGFVGQAATLVNQVGGGDGYALYNGTSMATPHVSGVAALIWNRLPDRSAAQVRAALTASALDLGTAGRDNSYGYGLVQAKAAYDALAAMTPGAPVPPPSGGGGGGTPPPPPTTGTPDYTLSTLSLNFGSIASGTSSTLSVTVNSIGTAPLTITGITISGSTAFTQTNTCGTSVAAGSFCTITVKFAPVAGGNSSGTMLVTPGDGLLAMGVTLSGAATTTSGTPTFTKNVSTLSFGNQTVNTTTATAKTVTVRNSSASVALPFSVSSISFGGANPTQYLQTNNCPSSLAPGRSCTVSVKFRPTSTGSKPATLVLAPTGATPQSVVLSGTGK